MLCGYTQPCATNHLFMHTFRDMPHGYPGVKNAESGCDYVHLEYNSQHLAEYEGSVFLALLELTVHIV